METKPTSPVGPGSCVNFTLHFQTTEEFARRLGRLVQKLNDPSEVASPAQDLPPKYVTKDQARAYLGNLSQPAFDRLATRKNLTVYQIVPGRRLYALEELDRIVQESIKKPAPCNS